MNTQTDPRTHYSVGFAFNQDSSLVALIEKRRGWQFGMLNGIGGHVEDGEDKHECQVREFREEAGVLIPKWEPFCTLRGADYEVECFTVVRDSLGDLVTTTDEPIKVVSTRNLMALNTVPNLQWIVPMAIDFQRCRKHAVITEPHL